ncbi:hypothetical protein Q4557_07230 [Shewanella sp. 5_MG-2023]|uniref:hypothetical protein n=1 Tax=Shewanella sp. 5_MG-2023 TaxID=3062656 RepID=UPI0026E34AE8|nr:hypothetical protein [Shewanella sp. 5_MG-2023]MDO6639752.1 hypothetical protein [Shewanella sp. 5_MG-2023]
MSEFHLSSKASKHFSFEQLILCGKTLGGNQIDNLPKQADSWRALNQLATKLLDPVYEQFGPLELTYGFCSPQLARLIAKNKNPHISPSLDQHCSHELNRNHKIICNRLGAACDFFIQDKSVDMQVVAKWISQNLKFDRMYYYGKNAPIHISNGPEMNQFLQLMKTHNATKRRSPSFKGRGDKVIQLIDEVSY